ncbi:ubiquinol-cytochrome-c reductase complex assembly factor 1 [Trichogramma pretiosum]|uniref:ubiquinol-cytochrome-c reductase complex assembly factor 1 n=1 Tax=Trichogramma pretiosum TaxID=7493 RepID=UPI0006C99157|nr:ubiquinol-cytochrome-c reductase complex assembly factor 1 [Trichogramma pretiosum]
MLIFRNIVRGHCINVFNHTKFSLIKNDIRPSVSFFKAKLHTNSSMNDKFYQQPLKKYELQVQGSLFYENIVDGLCYDKFYREYCMPDTLFSWFLVTELHVWMFSFQLMQDAINGEKLRNSLIETMWNDINTRIKKLKGVNTSVLKYQIKELSEQFNASLISYDEAIQSNDVKLANHLWFRFFQSTPRNASEIENLVAYIREQVKILNACQEIQHFRFPDK